MAIKKTLESLGSVWGAFSVDKKIISGGTIAHIDLLTLSSHSALENALIHRHIMLKKKEHPKLRLSRRNVVL